jgi:hypothetical protein
VRVRAGTKNVIETTSWENGKDYRGEYVDPRARRQQKSER